MRFDSYEEARSAIWPTGPLTPPPAYEAATAPSIDDTNPGQFIVFSGPSGTGKTWSVWGLINRWKVLNPHKGFFLLLNEAKLIDFLFCDHFLSAVVKWPRILVIDDLGYGCHSDQMPHQWLQHCAYVIANERGEQQLTTIYTTNLDQDRMTATYGALVASRVFGGRVIRSGGQDRRKQERGK